MVVVYSTQRLREIGVNREDGVVRDEVGDVLRKLEQEALRELAEKSRREHDVERVVNAAREYKELCGALDDAFLVEEQLGAANPMVDELGEGAESALVRLFEALDDLDGEAPDGAG